MAFQLPLIITLLFSLLLPQLALSNPAPAEITLGPQGYASFASLPSFSTLKPCAQGCLRYNGVYVCGMAGYGDLGSKIGCGCSPQNYCLCDKREASAVTSYIQSCVVTKCATPNEESAVLDLYNGYCLTANVAAATTSSKPYSFTGTTPSSSSTSTAASSTNTESGSRSAFPAAATSTGNTAPTDTTTTSTEPKKSPLLGIGAIIGISVGGVVLLGALLCLGCCMVWRKRRASKKAKRAPTYAATQPIENSYVAPANGANQLDGTGVFTKPTPNEKHTYVNPHTGAVAVADNVSPESTPGQTFAQPTQTAPVYQGTNNAHEMYGNQTYPQQQQQQQQQQHPQPQQYQQGMTQFPAHELGSQQRVHEMHGTGTGYQGPQQGRNGNVYEIP